MNGVPVAAEDEWAAARALFARDSDDGDETAGALGPLATELAALAVRLSDVTSRRPRPSRTARSARRPRGLSSGRSPTHTRSGAS